MPRPNLSVALAGLWKTQRKPTQRRPLGKLRAGPSASSGPACWAPDSHARNAGCVQTMASPQPKLIACKPRNAAKEQSGQDTAEGLKWLKKASRQVASPLLQCPNRPQKARLFSVKRPLGLGYCALLQPRSAQCLWHLRSCIWMCLIVWIPKCCTVRCYRCHWRSRQWSSSLDESLRGEPKKGSGYMYSLIRSPFGLLPLCLCSCRGNADDHTRDLATVSHQCSPR